MRVALKEAETKLAELFAEAASGKEVFITREDGTTVRIVVHQEPGAEARRGLFGSMKGRVRVADDFDDPLEDFDALHD